MSLSPKATTYQAALEAPREWTETEIGQKSCNHRRLSPVGNFVHHDGSVVCFNVNICVYLSEMIRAFELLL